MTSRFGAQLRQHREQQNVSLTTVADKTKIKASLLEGLERDDISHWPPGIFRRAYIRAYAGAIGLDPDVVIRQFLDVYPEPVEVVEAPPPPTGLRGLFGSAIGSLSRIRRSELAQGEPTKLPPIAEGKVSEGKGDAKGADTKIADRPSETMAMPTMGRVPSPEKAASPPPGPTPVPALPGATRQI